MRGLGRSIVASLSSKSKQSIFHAAGTNFLIVGITTVAGIVVARALGAEGRGYYAAIMAWFALAQVVGELGQSGAVTFWVSKDPARGKDYVASSRLLMLAVGTLTSAAGVALSGFFAKGEADVTTAFQIAFAGCLLNSVCAAYVYAVQAKSIWRWNTVRLAQPLVYLGLVFAFALTDLLDIVWLSIALVCSIVVQFVFAVCQAAMIGLTRGRRKRSLTGRLARYGIAYAGSAVPAAVSSQYDRLILSRTAPPEQLGHYSVAASVAGLAYPFSTAVASVVFPRAADATLGEAGRRNIERRAILGTAMVSAAVSVIIATLVGPFIPAIFGEEFRDSVPLVWWLIPGVLFRSVSQVIGALLRGRNRPGLVTYGQLCGLVAGSVAILPLMAWIGIYGAALAVALGELAVLLVALSILRAEQRRARTQADRT